MSTVLPPEVKVDKTSLLLSDSEYLSKPKKITFETAMLTKNGRPRDGGVL